MSRAQIFFSRGRTANFIWLWNTIRYFHTAPNFHFQVDAALGAEELVETLGNDKMTLQEKISQLEEEIADLEAIKDTNDQLLEAQKEIDVELREELDMALNAVREVCYIELCI